MIRLMGHIYTTYRNHKAVGVRSTLIVVNTKIMRSHSYETSDIYKVVAEYVKAGWEVYSVTTDLIGGFIYHIKKR